MRSIGSVAVAVLAIGCRTASIPAPTHDVRSVRDASAQLLGLALKNSWAGGLMARDPKVEILVYGLEIPPDSREQETMNPVTITSSREELLARDYGIVVDVTPVAPGRVHAVVKVFEGIGCDQTDLDVGWSDKCWHVEERKQTSYL